MSEEKELIKNAAEGEAALEDDFSLFDEFLEWVEAFVVALFVVVLVFIFILRVVEVSGPSMNSTLTDKDRIIVTHLNYTPEREDIVVFNSEGLNKCLIKRVIGVAGDTVVVNYDNDTVMVNGQYYDQSYINEADMRVQSIFDDTYRTGENEYTYVVPEGCVFTMGDNRNHSTDSRAKAVGFVKVEDLLGKAIFRFLPFSGFGSLN
ncbi:MAG: signal peptidase I [Ruminococcus sp.]|nr:signal peptidase I [Ruminococcus sp.]